MTSRRGGPAHLPPGTAGAPFTTSMAGAPATSRTRTGTVVAVASQCALAFACIAWPGTAFGQDPGASPPPPAPALEHEIVIDGWLGGGSTAAVREEGAAGTIGIGVTGLYAYRWLELGLGYTAEAAIFAFSAQVPGVLAGVNLEPVPWLRFDLLAEGGAYVVTGVGGGLFTTVESGGSAALPYVGGKASVSLRLGSAHRILLGWWVNAGDAVGRTTLYPVTETCFLGCSTNQETFTFGGSSWSMGLRVGGAVPRW
jgi:hypothetical protein